MSTVEAFNMTVHLHPQAEDLEEDFDPEAHDRRMRNLFSDDFYAAPEGDQKPEFPELDAELELGTYSTFKLI